MAGSSADLTILYITAQRLPESWQIWHRQHLDGFDWPVFQIGRASGDLMDTAPMSYCNIYRQLLRGCHAVSTPFVAMAEDDVLYSASHFRLCPPDNQTVVYNRHRWALFTWGPAIYSWRDRVSNCALIAPRALLIEALEERFAKYPDGWPEHATGEVGRDRVERQLGVTLRKAVELYSREAIVQLNHTLSTEDRQRRQRKALGPIQAVDIPHWGHATDVRTLFMRHSSQAT
jgi:hypothetical protein